MENTVKNIEKKALSVVGAALTITGILYAVIKALEAFQNHLTSKGNSDASLPSDNS